MPIQFPEHLRRRLAVRSAKRATDGRDILQRVTKPELEPGTVVRTCNLHVLGD